MKISSSPLSSLALALLIGGVLGYVTGRAETEDVRQEMGTWLLMNNQAMSRILDHRRLAEAADARQKLEQLANGEHEELHQDLKATVKMADLLHELHAGDEALWQDWLDRSGLAERDEG